APTTACTRVPPALPPFPTRRSSDLRCAIAHAVSSSGRHSGNCFQYAEAGVPVKKACKPKGLQAFLYSINDQSASTSSGIAWNRRSEEHTSELQSRENLICRLLLEKN